MSKIGTPAVAWTLVCSLLLVGAASIARDSSCEVCLRGMLSTGAHVFDIAGTSAAQHICGSNDASANVAYRSLPADLNNHANGVRILAPNKSDGCATEYHLRCDPTRSAETREPREDGCGEVITISGPEGCAKVFSDEAVCTPHVIPTPTPSQLEYQRHEIMGLTHFNMATYAGNGDPGCNPNNWNKGVNSSNAATFNPVKLNVSNWVESYKALGAKHAVLTAKHGCGFLLWDTSTVLPNGEEYRFAVMRKNSSSFGRNVIEEFVTTLTAAGLGTGFYYSTGNNYYLNCYNFNISPNYLPGQYKLDIDQYNSLVFQHVTELWTKFGNLTEIWFDHGYATSQKDQLIALLKEHQPTASGFGGFGLTPNAIKWVGTESGTPNIGVWSLGCDGGLGDPTSTNFCPTGVDTTLQEGDVWFWMPNNPIRTLKELIPIYHASVGNNAVLEMDFAIDQTGNVDPAHAAMYKALGDWARSCYSTPVASGNINGTSITLNTAGKTIDRVMIQEDLSYGQRVRSWTVDYQATAGGVWTSFQTGKSIGHKRIALGSPVSAAAVRLTISTSVATPIIMNFSAFTSCPTE